MAFIDLVVKYGWDSVTIMYENNESMMRLKEIFTRTTEVRKQYIDQAKLSYYGVMRKKPVEGETGRRLNPIPTR